jgi:hypothetical protein
VDHANKQGLQRGTSRREDMLDLVMAIRRPADYRPSEGARFELHFGKTRSLYGTAIDPIEARLTVDADGRAQWSWSKAEAHEFDRVAALLRDGLNPNPVARELGISKSKAYRLRQQRSRRPRPPDRHGRTQCRICTPCSPRSSPCPSGASPRSRTSSTFWPCGVPARRPSLLSSSRR